MALAALVHHVRRCVDNLSDIIANVDEAPSIDDTFLDDYLREITASLPPDKRYEPPRSPLSNLQNNEYKTKSVSKNDALQIDPTNSKLWNQAVLLCAGLSDYDIQRERSLRLKVSDNSQEIMSEAMQCSRTYVLSIALSLCMI